MASRSRLFSKIAKDIDVTGNLTAAAISSDVSFGASVYDSTGVLPYVGNTTGDQAYVRSNNRFYIWDSAGWYNVALINRAPTITSVLDSDGASSPFALSIDGIATTITITATDSDGDPVTYSAVTDANFDGLASITGSGNEFTVTPFSQDSATTESGTITFKATDGINISSNISTFTLNFLSALWDETVLSIGTSSTDGLDNSTFIDRSTNAHTVTPTGSPVQTAFHPYLDNWSVEFDGSGDILKSPTSADFAFGTGDFTVEFWLLYRGGNGYRFFWNLNDAPDYIGYGLNIGTLTPWLWQDAIVALGNTNVTPNVWQHHAVVRESGVIKIYLDGIEIASAPYTTNISTNKLICIGGNGVNNTQDTNGIYSNFRVVKGTALYTSNFTPPTEKLTAVSGTSLLTCQSNRFIDNSSNAHSITVSGDPAISAYNPFGQESEYVVGENKGSVLFESGDTLTRATTGFYTVTSFCIEFWIYPLSDQSHYICEGTQQGSGTWRITIDSSSGGIGFSYAAGSWAGVNFGSGTGRFKSHEWTHIAISKTSSGVFRIFINGVEVGTQTNTSSLINTGRNFQFGYYVDGSGTNYSNALFSDFKITRQDPVYTSNFTVPTSPVGGTNLSTNDPYMYLPMDNAGIFDKTGNHTLTLVGDPATSTTQTKYANTSVYQSVDVIHIDNFNYELINSDWTLEGWFYSQGTASVNTMFHINNDGSPSGVHVHHDASGTLKVDDGAVATDNFGTMALNQWQHLAIVRNNGTTTAYVNGTSVGNHTSWDPASPTNRLQLGRYASNANYTYTGYYENVQFVHGVAKYTANFTPPTQTQGRIYQAED
jgi:hypothetical protein